jgi:UDP-N-acetylmuramoylalanine--D-glutamate ligase
MEFFAKELNGLLPYTKCHTIQNALREAYKQAQPNEVILLAPACASFDQFKNFEERGTLFKQWAHELVGAGA